MQKKQYVIINQLNTQLNLLFTILINLLFTILINLRIIYVPYMQWKNAAKAYFDEAKWFHEGYIPSMEEYMRVATASAGNTTLTTISLLGMGDIVTKESLEWLLNDPKILRAFNTVIRLMDDIVSSKVQSSYCSSLFHYSHFGLSTVTKFYSPHIFSNVFALVLP